MKPKLGCGNQTPGRTTGHVSLVGQRHLQLGRLLGWLCFLSLIGLLPTNPVRSQGNDESEKEAYRLAETAATAQNEGDFSFAATRWKRLLDEYPGSSLIGKANYNLGICHVFTNQFDLAAGQLKKTIEVLGEQDAALLPNAMMYLGFAHFRMGQQAAQSSDPSNSRQSNIELTTATEVFGRLTGQFPNFEDIDQAYFFQATAFENLGRLDEALGSLEKMFQHPNPNFLVSGKILEAQIREAQGNPSAAIEVYQSILTKNPDLDPAIKLEVDFFNAQSHMMLANQQLKQQQSTEAIASFGKAETIFERVASLDATQVDVAGSIAHEAAYQRAFCLANLDQKPLAAELFTQISKVPESPFAMEATINASRMRMDLNQIGLATELLEQATAGLQQASNEAPLVNDAILMLLNLYFQADANEKAFRLADETIDREPPTSFLPALLNARADAAWRIESRRAESPELFMQVVTRFPNHSLAPSALYNAAFGWFQLNQIDNALTAVERFQKDYPQQELIADVGEIKADALLLTDEVAAETEYAALVNEYPQHKKRNRWRLRLAVAQFFQEKYQDTIDTLSPAVNTTAAAAESNPKDSFSDPKQRAEALHWLGSSYFFLDSADQAIQFLQQSLQTEVTWSSSDETRLMLLRSYLKSDQETKLRKSGEQFELLKKQFPQSPLIAKAQFFLGDHAYQTADYTVAADYFQGIVEQHPQSELIPAALYNAAWSYLKQDKTEEANQLFSQLLTSFPDHELALEAQAGRGVASRKGGDMQRSIEDLKAFVNQRPAGEENFKASFELGLAYVANEDWNNARQVFQQLLNDDTASDRRDAYHYELAWALRKLNQPEQALIQFATIAEKFPQSAYTAESLFHLASDAYDQDEFDTAIQRYQQAITLANPESAGNSALIEKGLYKLGWAFFKQNQFEKAHEQFRELSERYPDGSLFADALFMSAETFYQQQQYAPALEVYQKAIPVIERSGTVDSRVEIINRLHAAQSANQLDQFELALELAQPLVEDDKVPSFYQADAWLEIGNARQGLEQPQQALIAWQNAKRWGGEKTSVRARCSIGDHHFANKDFDAAVDEFKEVNYQFAGKETTAETKAWLAYALYEIARCHYVQIRDANNEQRSELIRESIRHFELLIERYPDDRLAAEAQRQLESLLKLRR